MGDDVYRGRGESETYWVGTAGDACRRELTSLGGDIDSLDGVIGQTQEALEVFANRIDAVQRQMAEAREAAKAELLITTPTAILPPGPGPGTGPGPLDGAASPRERQQHEAAVSEHNSVAAEYERKTKAFEAASTAVERARDEHAQAHKDLEQELKDPQQTVKELKKYGMFVVGNGLMWVKTTQTTANDLLSYASKMEGAATTMQARVASTPSPAMRELVEGAARKGMDKAADAHAQYAQVQRMSSAVPPKVRGAIEANPGNFIKSGGTAATISKNVLRGLPAVGTTLTIGSAGADVAMGKDLGNAAADTAANLGGSIAGGLAVGAAVGSVFPGPGNVVGGVIGGIAGGILATGVVDMIQGDI